MHLIYEPVIGLEIHAQLKTSSKMFCACSTQFGGDPNSQTCPVCLGMPGVLPVLNREAVAMALKIAVATESRIMPYSIFARKNYFYPDLAKGYQISQYEEPLCEQGRVEIYDNGQWIVIGLERIHMEEDTGKLLHPEGAEDQTTTRVDFNRCGVPLLEIVSRPVIRTPEQAYRYLTTLKQMLLYLEICDGNMEEGSLRCDVNISLRPLGSDTFGTKTEIKNVNSFNGVQKALEYEINRQTVILDSHDQVIQQTLDWDANTGIASPIRTKEMAHDYRYFPEPDLVPLVISQEWTHDVAAHMPELPQTKIRRFISDYNLPYYDADVLTQSQDLADYYESVVKAGIGPKKASNWIMTEFMRVLNEQKIDIHDFPVSSGDIVELLVQVDNGVISGSMAKEVFEDMLRSGDSATVIIRHKGLEQISDTKALKMTIEKVLEESSKELDFYLKGKDKLFGYFVGQVMKATRGKANPRVVNDVLREILKSYHS